MRRRPFSSTLAVCSLVCIVGCSSYHYMRDPSVDLENSRSEYVQNNPGNKFNDDIGTGKVRKGMSRLQVRVTWGDPDQVAPQPPGVEFWSYHEGDPARGTSVYRLRFERELLTAIDVERSNVNLRSDDDPDRRQRRDDPEQVPDTASKPGPR